MLQVTMWLAQIVGGRDQLRFQGAGRDGGGVGVRNGGVAVLGKSNGLHSLENPKGFESQARK